MRVTRRLAALGASASIAVLSVAGFASTAQASPAGPAMRPAASVEALPMVLTPDTIDAGGSTTITGDGCLPRRGLSATVHISIIDDQEHEVDSLDVTPVEIGDPVGSAPEDGSWSAVVPVADPGVYTVMATCDVYIQQYYYIPATLTVNEVETSTTTATSTSTSTDTSTVTTSTSSTPQITLVGYTGSIQQGGSVGIDASGFLPGEKVNVTLHSAPIPLGSLIADNSGNARGNVTIPLEAPIGGHTITLVGAISGISLEAEIIVVAAVEHTVQSPVVETTTIGLASTGVNAAAMTVWGIVLLVAGGIAVALTRKRHGKHVGD